MDNDDPWAQFARIHSQADSANLSDTAWGTDEALGVILDSIEARQPLSAKQADNLVENRAAKYRRRRRILGENASCIAPIAVNENERIQALCALREHQERCSDREWRVLVFAAFGNSYSNIARSEDVPEATIKTWIRRARLKLAA